ncbi:Conjugal transfer protein (plasmid) [Paramixta manurensis]|uniref:Conjugal transfer protein n=1 Tax=Paramixta manurensis TaxID=2740817 RepID=A0A6M8UI88_9GAMM|nr:Conjugal transfer protein [Erwiniaceae bacterium PD-1]
MTRRNVYFKEKIEREVLEHVQMEIQNGATHGDINFSSVVNELVEFALRIKKLQKDSPAFDETGYKKELIRKVAGSREASSIMMVMLAEMYLGMRGEGGEERLAELINTNLTAMNDAEDSAENKFFLQDEADE